MRILTALLLFPIAFGLKQICPGGTARCPDSSTCCQLLDKSYGCCPLENAICCDDHIHCCPASTKCSAGMCVQTTNSSTSTLTIKTNDIICPGGEVTCPDETTCCKSPPQQTPKYGCCPMRDAVCCNDGFHCCPNGTKCDLKEGRCLGDGFTTEMCRKKSIWPHYPETKLAAIRLSSQLATNVICPGSGFQCPAMYTCCMTQSGVWGCCPFPNAECCVDKIHCCPEYMHCDATSQYCSQGVVNTISLPKVQATEILEDIKMIDCPDKTKCGDMDTCCKISDEKYGCCPYVNATCCSDRLHCCPSNSKCDLQLRQCIHSESWMSNALDTIFRKF